MRSALSFFCLIFLLACAPQVPAIGGNPEQVAVHEDHWTTRDGLSLPLHHWQAHETPKAIVIGVHGFNDYGRFVTPGFADYLAQNNVSLFTYDQRGFGAAPERGRWAGRETLTQDLADFISLIQSQNPALPLYVLGESMGGAMVIVTFQRHSSLEVDGLILNAPALWGPSTWPFYQRWMLSFFSFTMPWLQLSGGGIVQPTDHLETWKAWSEDPLVIRSTRMEALYGVSQLMEEALSNIGTLDDKTLMLYGAKDEVIPPIAIKKALPELGPNIDFALYDEGWHMLTRDHNGPVVWKDILSWINGSETLPSGAQTDAKKRTLLIN